MVSYYNQPQSSVNAKRNNSHFEIESPFPESNSKRLRFNISTNNANEIENNDLPISPVLSVFNNLDPQIRNNQDLIESLYNNHVLTPATTPADLKQFLNTIQTNDDTLNDNNEIYSEIEEYMMRGYCIGNEDQNKSQNNNNNNNNNSITPACNIAMHNNTQYALYDLTNEEIVMNSQHDLSLNDYQMQ